MIYKNGVCIFLIFLVYLITSCSKKEDVNGIYVHYKGEQRYYTLTISDNNNGDYKVLLEGVPIDEMKKIPWTLECTTAREGRSMKCETFTLSFNDKLNEVRVTYESGISQVFISNKIDIDEEVIHYETDKK